MISIIIAAKDSEKWIPKTIQSLLAQTFKSWECIVSINGSSDGTYSFISSIQDKRFQIIQSDIPNKSLALNRALIKSKYEIISILDADDLWDSQKLEVQLDEIEKCRNIDIVGTQLAYIDENDEIIQRTSPILPHADEDCKLWLKMGKNPIANSSVLYLKSIHDKIGYYDPEKFAVEDYDMWMRSLRANLNFKNLQEQFLLHRLHATSNFNTCVTKQQVYKILVDDINQYIDRVKTVCS